MNYLVHLYLAEPTEDSLLGALMGDFVKGPLAGLPGGLQKGILRHRTTDAFAQTDPSFRASKRRIDDSFGVCKGVLVDIFYDHFMACLWREYHELSLEAFAQEVYGLLERRGDELPEGLRRVAPRMIEHDWLVSYRRPEIIPRVLQRLAARLRRANPLARGFAELQRNYGGLEQDFRAFLPAAEEFLRPRGEA